MNLIQIPEKYYSKEYALSQEEMNNINTAFFTNNLMYDVEPKDASKPIWDNLDVAYDARYLVSDNRKYDLFNPKDIVSIIMPTKIDRPTPNKHSIQEDYGILPTPITITFVEPTTPVLDLDYQMALRIKRCFSPELVAPLLQFYINLIINKYNIYKNDNPEDSKYDLSIQQRLLYQLIVINDMDCYEYFLEEVQSRSIKLNTKSNVMSKEGYREWGQRNMELIWIRNNLPELAPKNLKTYTKMKYAKTSKYLQIVEAAREKNYFIT